MTIENLSYSERLKQRADLSAVIRLAESFLDLWADDAAEGSDEERAELAKARAEFDAVRPLVEAAPNLHQTLTDVREWWANDTSEDGDMPAEIFDRMAAAARLEALPIVAPDLVAMIDEIHDASDRDIYTDAPECADAIDRLKAAIFDAKQLIGNRRCIGAQSVAMIQQIARMKTDDEIQDESDGGQCMENDDAVSTVNSLIDQARGILSAVES